MAAATLFLTCSVSVKQRTAQLSNPVMLNAWLKPQPAFPPVVFLTQLIAAATRVSVFASVSNLTERYLSQRLMVWKVLKLSSNFVLNLSIQTSAVPVDLTTDPPSSDSRKRLFMGPFVALSRVLRFLAPERKNPVRRM